MVRHLSSCERAARGPVKNKNKTVEPKICSWKKQKSLCFSKTEVFLNNLKTLKHGAGVSPRACPEKIRFSRVFSVTSWNYLSNITIAKTAPSRFHNLSWRQSTAAKCVEGNRWWLVTTMSHRDKNIDAWKNTLKSLKQMLLHVFQNQKKIVLMSSYVHCWASID